MGGCIGGVAIWGSGVVVEWGGSGGEGGNWAPANVAE